MPATTSIIETGVDLLVKLVSEKGKISVADAANELGVSVAVIRDWADFLEEEGIISIQQSLTKPYLIKRKLTKKEIDTKAKEFEGKKDVFIRKAQVTTSFLEKEAVKLKEIQAEIEKIKQYVGFDVTNLGKELDDLRKYEELRINLSADIQKQRESSKTSLENLSGEISKVLDDYQNITKQLGDEEHQLEREKDDALSLEEREKELKNKIIEIQSTIDKLGEKIKLENNSIENSKRKIDRIKEQSEEIQLKADKEKKMLMDLVEKSKEYEKKIISLHDKIFQKLSAKGVELEKVKNISLKLKQFFGKKIEIMAFMDKLNHERASLEKELVELIKKAKGFQLTTKSIEFENEVLNLEDQFNAVDKKIRSFEEEYKKLGELLRKQ